MIAAAVDVDRTRADCAARDARVEGMFNALQDDFDRIFGKFQESGVLRDPHLRTREGDPA